MNVKSRLDHLTSVLRSWVRVIADGDPLLLIHEIRQPDYPELIAHRLDRGQNVVRGNLIHGVRGTWSGWGLYTDAETNRERIESNVVWDCNAPKIDYEYGGPNNNQWINNVLSVAREEPPQSRTLRDTIAAGRKKGLNPPDVAP
jgi:hypothetical protein